MEKPFASIDVNGFFLYIHIMLEFIKTFVIGIFVGIANVIPGVSGGTLVVVFNVYDKFVNAITLNVKKLLKNWKFVVPVFLGMGAGILIFSKVITKLFENFPGPTNFFFTGLILGSIPLLINYTFKRTNNNPEKVEHFSALQITGLILSILAGLLLILLFAKFQTKFDKNSIINLTELPEISTSLILKLFIGGILGAIAMIIPGISGSLIMLILGIYTVIISAVSGLTSGDTFIHAAILLIPAGIGMLVGLFAGAKIISILIEKIPNYTYAVILGLIAGSAIVIFPYDSCNTLMNGVAGILCLNAGFALAFFSTKFSDIKNTENDENSHYE